MRPFRIFRMVFIVIMGLFTFKCDKNDPGSKSIEELETRRILESRTAKIELESFRYKNDLLGFRYIDPRPYERSVREYDMNGNLVRESTYNVRDGGKLSEKPNDIFYFKYDDSARLVSEEHYHNPSDTNDSFVFLLGKILYVYDDKGLLVEELHYGTDHLRNKHSYAYDSLGRVSVVVIHESSSGVDDALALNLRTIEYEYDSSGRTRIRRSKYSGQVHETLETPIQPHKRGYYESIRDISQIFNPRGYLLEEDKPDEHSLKPRRLSIVYSYRWNSKGDPIDVIKSLKDGWKLIYTRFKYEYYTE